VTSLTRRELLRALLGGALGTLTGVRTTLWIAGLGAALVCLSTLAACDGMTRYARYNPALDDNGNPTTGSDTRTIVYQLGR